MFKNKYRIKKDIYNTHFSIEKAEQFAKNHAENFVKYL
jgi:hypothetical protein